MSVMLLVARVGGCIYEYHHPVRLEEKFGECIH